MITDPKTIKIELEKAIAIAISGRPGPVWLDIPLNVQGSLIDENELNGNAINIENTYINKDDYNRNGDLVVKELLASKRPVLIAGHGVRISKGEKKLLELVNQLKIPTLTTFNGFDLIPTESEYFIGRIGTLGSRAGNFALQNADLVICIGTRNNIRQVSYQSHLFAKNAKKIIVDIDAAELYKQTVKGDILIHADASIFISKIFLRMPHDYTVDES